MAFYGLPGEIVKAIDPNTEADPIAVLGNILVMFGNVIGRGPYSTVEYTPHYTNLFICQVGATAKARKGQSLSVPERLYRGVDPAWSKEKVISGGLSSGEGLIYNVRDARDFDPATGHKDPGILDKRLLIVEGELSQALKSMSREGNTLSPVLRNACDEKDLHPLTKNSPITASNTHISIIGQITREELLRHLTELEMASGFGNRFNWFYVERSKNIPTPKPIPDTQLQKLVDKLKKAVSFAKGKSLIKRDKSAERFWIKIYDDLSNAKPGLWGAMIARGEAQVLRISLIYALMDQSPTVRRQHLEAALAVWRYTEESVKLIFGMKLGDPHADRVKENLKLAGSLTRTDIHHILGRNVQQWEVDRVIKVLSGHNLASVVNENSQEVLFDVP